MKKGYTFFITLALIFLALSGIIYLVHYLIFRDVRHIFIYLLGDLAFLPLEVFLVVLVIERLLSRREKQANLQKLNMVVGAFFSEIGSYLLQHLLKNFDNREEICRHLNLNGSWKKKDFRRAARFAYHLRVDVDVRNLFYSAFMMALIQGQFVSLFNASLLDAMHASPFSA